MIQTDEFPTHVWKVIGSETARILYGWGVTSYDGPEDILLFDPHAVVEPPPLNPTELAVRALNEGTNQPMPIDPSDLYTRVARVCALSVLALTNLPHPAELGLDVTVYDGLFEED
jgi:hypothetical protein